MERTGQGCICYIVRHAPARWKGVAVLGSLPHCVRRACQVPTLSNGLTLQHIHYLPLCVDARFWDACPRGRMRLWSVSAVGDDSIGIKQVFAWWWSDCVGICRFQTVGSVSALSERTSRSEAVNLVSATHFHERERVWK